LTGFGSAASVGNTASGSNIGLGGTGAAGGIGGTGREGGNGQVADGRDGDAGAAGATGANGASGQLGAADTFLVNADGGVSAIDGAADTIVYLAIDNAVQDEGSGGAPTVFRVYVNRAGDLSHTASVEVSFVFNFPNPEFDLPVSTNQFDFAGGVLPSSGVLTFAANERQKVITITVAGDTQLEGNEQFSVSLGSWVGMQAGATVQVTGTILNDDTGLPPSTGDAPDITDYQGNIAIFNENAGPAFIDVSRNSQVRDTDSPYLNGGRLTITISQNYVAGEDVLSFVTEQDGVSLQGDYLYYGAAQIGRVINLGQTLIVNFTADATPALASKILSAVTYDNTSDTPNTATRTISVTVTDGEDGNVSVVRTGTVIVQAADDKSVIDLDADNSSGATGTGYKTTYAPGAARIAVVDSDVTVTDPDGPNLELYAQISLANAKLGDRLSIVDPLPAGIQVLIEETGDHQIWLIGNATYAQYAEALRQIRFHNTESNPDRTTRDIFISIAGESSRTSIVVGVPPGLPNDNNGAANSVVEGAAAGTAVGITALASDSDGNPITYSLDNDAGGRFAINASTGVVTVSAAGAATIDYESAPGHAYGITVRASDGTGFSTTRDFSIAVTNFTPLTPTDSNGAAGGSVQEGAANGSGVGITASSSERGGDAVIYSIVGGDGRFAIDAATGVVTVANTALIDYESATSHTITVRAADAGGAHGADQSFTIAVTNAPPSTPVDIDGAAGGSIAENAALHDQVAGIQLAATDPNGGTVTYNLVNSAGGRFGITSLGYVIVMNPDLLDYESSASHTIVVRAKDAAGLFTEQSFTIAVTDVAPSAPVDTDGTSGATVDEGLRGPSGGLGGGGGTSTNQFGEVGITAHATDPRGGTVTYSLSDNAGGLFAIDAVTGVVTVAPDRTLNHDGAAPHDYVITVLASAGSLSTSQTLTVTVNNVAPFAPEDVDGAADAVSEGAANGATVGLTLVASDPGGATFTWSLIDDADGRFAIDANGVVTVANASLIDYQGSGGSYTIVAQVSDGSLTSTQSFTIAVTNAAPAAPTDADGVTGGTISEDAATGSAVGITAVAADPSGGAVTYSLTGDAGGRFAIDAASGIVTVADASLIDYEGSGGGYTIMVAASDGLLTSTQSLIIAVSDVAPGTPSDADGTTGATFDEGLGAGAAIGITAQSSDPHGGTVTYSLTDDAGGRFAIDAATGVVTVASGVTIDQDGALSQDYSITVKASAGSLSTSQAFTVTLNNVAPATPGDSDSAANTVSEGAADGDAVGLTLTSSDPGGASFTWSLTDDADGRFAIDATTGVVTVANASLIDYEGSGGAYTIVAQASDGSLTSTQSFTIAVTNVAPASTGDSYTVDEDETLTVAAPGTLGNDGDVNGGTLTAVLQSGPQHAASFALNPDGSFSYTPAADYNGDDSFTYVASDGSTAGTPVTVAITINPVNDAPEVNGAATLAAIAEDSGGRIITQSELLGTASDIDSPVLEARNLAIFAGAGSLTDHHDGTWTYTPALNDDTSVTFSFEVTDGVADLVAATATLDVTPVNDAPAGAGGLPSAGVVAAEQVATVVDATVVVTDPDNTTLPSGTVSITGNFRAGEDALAFHNSDSSVFGNIAAAYAAASGVLTLTSAGGTATLVQWQAALRTVTFTNTSDTPDTGDRTITFTLNDGSTSGDVATSTVGIVAVNDAPVNVLPPAQAMEANHSLAIAGLSIGDDAASGTLTTTLSVAHGVLSIGAAGGATVDGSGSSAVTLTGTLAQINAALSAADNIVYTPVHDFFGHDTLTFTTSDGGNSGTGGALTDSDTLSIAVSPPLAGTGGDDSYEAAAGNERIDAGSGVDTITFDFKLTDATVTYVGYTAVIDGPNSHTVLSGFERFVFTDGTVDNADSDRLVDDLYYYSHNRDVWNAHADADTHYHTTGWREGRDPNAFFSTSFYLALNPDVRAAGVDPLLHYAASGWHEGRLPSLSFDPAAYLAANPDVAAAHVDPLLHMLLAGAGEKREPIVPVRMVESNGFDYVYYLQTNPDVAAAGVDPLWHFQNIGWKEGRDPNAFFDTKGYLATYTDVAAAGLNPLDHYNVFGWREGRDPSVDFDTTSYLAANPDVKAAGINPLDHFLLHGIDEQRSAQADGVWG
jgi:hypothetical protein